jgi:SM-20-related protein
MQPKTKADAASGPILDLEKVRSAKLVTIPYDYIIVSNFIVQDWCDRLIADFPQVQKGGSFPLASVKCGSDFSKLINELDSPDFRQAVEEQFSVDLKGPTIFTVRGYCRQADGKIHTDSESKIITVLLYMNPKWATQGGRLRILNGPDVNDVAAEVSPEVGNLLIFRRCDYSFHGHLPFEGERKVIQMNWVTEQKYADREARRHKWSAVLKRLRFS